MGPWLYDFRIMRRSGRFTVGTADHPKADNVRAPQRSGCYRSRNRCPGDGVLKTALARCLSGTSHRGAGSAAVAASPE